MLGIRSLVHPRTESWYRSYSKGREFFTYHVERFELRRNSLSRLRCITIILPRDSSMKFHQRCMIIAFISYYMSIISDLVASLSSRPYTSAH